MKGRHRCLSTTSFGCDIVDSVDGYVHANSYHGFEQNEPKSGANGAVVLPCGPFHGQAFPKQRTMYIVG